MDLKEMEFTFQNLSIFRDNEKLIKDVTGCVKQGEILMILGHESCGHSLLLAALAGRCPLYEGEIRANDNPIQYSALPQTVAYVTSSNLFLPTLTVRENLKYAGLLRLPQSMHTRDKMKIIRNTEQLLGLQDEALAPTQFASRLTKKRLSVASELFQPTEIIVIDDPFHSLNYDESQQLVTLLSIVARQLKKGVILSTSSPSSHVISQASKVICLNHGQVVYQGAPPSLADFLSLAGFQISKLQSPLDLLMELVLDPVQHQKLASLSDKLRTDEETNNLVWLKDTDGTDDNINHEATLLGDLRETVIDADVTHRNGADHVTIESQSLLDLRMSRNTQTCGFHTSFCHQLSVLLPRCFHNARRRILSPISLVQNGYILLLCVLVWWRTPRTEETIKDRMGLFFFTTVQWAFFSLLDAILTFPKEVKVIQQERKYKLYRISAYCIAKTISELPLTIVQPGVYMCVIYWVANLNNMMAFIGSLGVLAVDVIAAQSIGLLLGTALNPPWTVLVVPLGLLSMMLWGGAFSTPPTWLQWGKYASYFTYGLNAFISLEFQHADPIECATKSMVPTCNAIDPITNVTVTQFPSDVILAVQNITWSPLEYSSVLIGLAVVTRVLWYIVLRQRRD